MRLHLTNTSFWLAVSTGILILSGCAGSTTNLDSAEHAALLKNDRGHAAGGEAQNLSLSLSVEEAVARGLENNLDARVAALEALSQQDAVTLAQLRAFPAMKASGGYAGRSRESASSSRSVETGQESLEPSLSTDRHRRTAALEADWNLLEAALALADASRARDEAGIAAEAFAKVLQNVERDVYTAYWRAKAYQDLRHETERLFPQAQEQMDKLKSGVHARLISSAMAADKMAILADKTRTLRDLQGRLRYAEMELKGLLSLPPEARLTLTSSPPQLNRKVSSILARDASEQEWDALLHRPEMREEVLKKNITIRDARREIFQTFPGLNLLIGKNYDSNSFLAEPNWTDFSVRITQSITDIITLPDRYRAAKNKEAVADARRQALSSAIVTQVHIARERLAVSRDDQQSSTAAKAAAQKRRKAIEAQEGEGFSSGYESLVARLDAQIESYRAALSAFQLYESYAAMQSTLGKSVTSVPVPGTGVRKNNGGGA
jgi:outer membrane protein TolC